MMSTSALNQSNAERANSQSFVFPASFAQRRLWFLDQLNPGDPTYTVPGGVEMEGPIDVDALERSLQEIVRRHEALRTRFDANRGEPQQVIDSEATLTLRYLDLRSIPEQERKVKADQISREEAKKPFDLRSGPLFRVTLMCLADWHHRLVLIMHHIISDRWSVGVLIRELAVLYNAFTQGEPSPLPELPIQYVDYTAWQQEQLSGEALQGHLEYWKRQLDGVQAELDLLTDRPHRQDSSNQGAQYYFDIEPDLTRDLRMFGREQGATLYMVLLAGYQALLHHHTGQQELLVGSPVAGRTRTEIEGLIGFFVNTIVTKAAFTKSTSFRQLVKHAKETTLDAFAHQDLPFEKLVEELSPQRNVGRTPFFQTMFSLQNESMLGLKLGSANLRVMDIDIGTAKFELTFVLTESGDVIKASFEYSTELFNQTTIVSFADRFKFLIQELITEPDRPISEARLVSEPEMTRLALGWTAPSVAAMETQRGFLSRLAEHAHSETKLAIVSNGQRITYADLDERAQQVSKRLRAHGIAPAAHVGICVRNGIEGIVALLGILKAGAVAVPVGAEEPMARLQFIFKDADAEWAIGDSSHSERLQQAGARVLTVDDPVPLAPASAEHSNIEKGAAVVLYQSDASGRPKGVIVPYSGLLPRTFAGARAILETDRIGINVRLGGQDGEIPELLRCLAIGATLIDLGEHAPRKLATTLLDERVAVLHARTAELERLARGFNWAFKTVRMIVLRDDYATEMDQMRQHLLPEVLNRVYGARGSNETFGWWVLYPLAEGSENITDYLAAGTRLWLLDSRQQPVPKNIVGELYIGGKHLGFGDHCVTDREAVEALANRGAIESGISIYRSGEFGWRRADGSLQFCGRRDGRGWISGVRVEAGEIECALQNYGGLRDAAVLVGNTGVRGFVVVSDGEEFNPEAIQTWLRERLPELMVPHKFDRVEKIPRHSYGTANRKALKALADQLDTLAEKPVYVAPRNEIEQKLVTIWEQTLGLDRVGIHDDFFRIGGHSLLATQMIARITDELGVEVPVRQLFTTSTVAQLADLVAHSPTTKAVIPIKRLVRPFAVPQSQKSFSSQIVVCMQPEGRKRPFFCMHPVGGSILCYAELAHDIGCERPFYALQSPVPGPHAEELLSIEQMAALYIGEVRKVQRAGPYLLGGWSLGGLLAYEMARQLASQGETTELLAMIDAYPPTPERKTNISMLVRFAAHLGRSLGKDLRRFSDQFLELGAEEQWMMLMEAMVQEGVLPRETAQRQLTDMLNVFTQNTLAVDKYSLQENPQNIMLFIAAESENPEHIASEWSQWAGETVELHVISGDHYTIVQQPNVSQLAGLLRCRLEHLYGD